jgi:hypothetical protein
MKNLNANELLKLANKVQYWDYNSYRETVRGDIESITVEILHLHWNEGESYANQEWAILAHQNSRLLGRAAYEIYKNEPENASGNPDIKDVYVKAKRQAIARKKREEEATTRAAQYKRKEEDSLVRRLLQD